MTIPAAEVAVADFTYEPFVPAGLPAPLPASVKLDPPLYGVASPFTPVDGQNRDLILEAIRAWSRDELLPWAKRWHENFGAWREEFTAWFNAWAAKIAEGLELTLSDIEEIRELANLARAAAEDAARRAELAASQAIGALGLVGEYPEKYGVIGQGKDADCIQKAHDAAALRGVPLVLNGVYTFEKTVRRDMAKVTVLSYGGECNPGPAMIPGQFMFEWYSSDPNVDIGSPIRQRGHFWQGVVIWGNGLVNGVRIASDVPGYKVAHGTMLNSTVTKCDVGIDFGMHAYMDSFAFCNFAHNRVGIRHLVENDSGERLVFTDCDLTGSGLAVQDSTSQSMHFKTCSFSYVLRQVLTMKNGSQYWENCHVELSSPYAPFFEMTGSGYLHMTGTRWLFRNQGGGNVSLYDFRAGDTAYWDDNVRDRFKDGDAVKFTSIGAGLTGITAGTTYYLLNVTRQSFRLAATLGGAAITWGGSGKVTGMNPVGGGYPVFQIAANGTVIVDGGHVGGSSTELEYWADGAGQLIMEKTGTFNNVAMRLHHSPLGELRDPTFAQSTAIAMRDPWVLTGAGGTLSLSTDKLKGVQSLMVTKTAAGGTLELSLTVPIRLARLLWSFNFKKAGGNAIHEAFMLSQLGGTRGSSLWTSTHSVNGAWTPYTQPSRYYQSTPRWATHIVFTWALGALGAGDTFQIDVPRLSFS